MGINVEGQTDSKGTRRYRVANEQGSVLIWPGRTQRSGATKDAAIEAVADLSRDQLIDTMDQDLYKRRPPKGISRTMLERSAAYQAQVKAYGGLDVLLAGMPSAVDADHR